MSRGRAMGPGKLTKRGRHWVLAYRDEFGTHRRRALATDKATAERIRSDLINRRDLALAGLGSEAGQSATLREVVDEYLADLETRAGARHFKQTRSRLAKALTELGELRVRDLKPMHALRLRSVAVAAGRGHRTANLIVTTLQAALRWAAANELIAHSPIANVKKLEEAGHERCKRRALTEDEIERFLAASRADDEDNDTRAALEGITRVPQTPLWSAFLNTGGRYAELTKATWGDLDLGRGLLTFRAANTKGKKERVVPLAAAFARELRALKMLHENVLGRLPTVGERIFLSPEGAAMPWHSANCMRVFHRLLERAGIPKTDAQGQKLDIHALRHTYATRLARNSVPLAKTQRLLGHSDPSLTARVYTHLSVEDLRDAVETLDTKHRGKAAKEAR